MRYLITAYIANEVVCFGHFKGGAALRMRSYLRSCGWFVEMRRVRK